MIFVCGSLGAKPCAATRASAERMATARRVARTRDVQLLQHGAIAVASAACQVEVASAGSVSVLLFRPAWQAARAGQTELEALARGFAADGALDATRLDGPFVLLAHDSAARRAALANDRFGICPVHVRDDRGTLNFATDLSALVAAGDTPPALDAQAIYDYVFFHCIPAPRTIYRGVSKLGPATCLNWQDGSFSSATYWHPEFAPPGDSVPDGADLLAALERAVDAQAADACGAFLSGGLDSSSVAGMLKRARGEAATFTIGFDADGYDESAFARRVAEHFATNHHEYYVTPGDVCDALPLIAGHYGEPFGNSSVIPAYYCARFARDHGVGLMLAGDGGDELFAGNTRYTDQNVFETWFRVPAALRATLKAAYRALPVLEGLPLAGKGARYIQQAEMGLPDRLQSYNFLNRFDPAKVFAQDWLDQVDTNAPWAAWRERYATADAPSALQRMLYLDWKFTLADNDLVKVSNMCELAGVEVTYPMLANGVVDLSCRLPAETLLEGGELRGFYKNSVRDFLPAATIEKSKHGFGLPFGVWMQHDAGLRSMAAEALDQVATRGILRADFVREARRLHEQGTAGYYGELVWILVMLEMWLQAHGH